MNRAATILSAILFIFPATLVFADEAEPTATYEDFVEWGNRLEGRWVSTITLIADWPGIDAKQGEVVTGYTTFRWVADKRGIEETEFIANQEGKKLHFWDAGSKHIKIVCVTSAGSTWTACIGRDGDNWPFTVEGSLPDGTKTKGNGVDTLTGNGRFVVDGTLSLGGKKLPHLHDVYEKVSK